MPGQPH